MAKPFKSWTSNKSMSWGFGEPMKLGMNVGGISNQDKFNSNYAMQKNLKPIWSKDSGLPKFFLPKFSPKKNWKQSKNPEHDTYKQSTTGIQFSLAPPMTPNAVKAGGTSSNSFPVGTTWNANDGPEIKGGIQTSTGYIMEKTLFKENDPTGMYVGNTGMDTISGMSKQYITTTKFSNPTDFGVTQYYKGATNNAPVESWDEAMNRQKTQTGQDEDGVISTSKLNQMISEGATRNEILAMGRTITSNPNSTLSQTGINTQTLIRGSNYANINYPSNKKIAEATAAKKIAQEARAKLKTLLPHLTPDGSIKPPEAEDNNGSSGSGSVDTGRPDGLKYAVKSYSGSKASRRGIRYYKQAQAFKSDPTVRAANSIQSKLGRSPIVDSWTRIGYGNRQQQADYITPSKNIIEDYNKKTTVNTWAKTIDPEHASISPTKIISVVDIPKKVTKSYNITTHKYDTTVRNATYKDVPVSNYGNEGVKMDMLYAKVMKKSKEKKTKYKTYYDTHADVLDYNYYGVTDSDLSAFKEHKDYLLEDISYRRSNQKEIINRLKLDTKTIEQKDRSGSIIPVLESDVDTLDTKSTVIKKQLGEYDWQTNISQDAFGTDTIQGESHVSGVLDSYGGQVRGGNYYTQDVGNLIRNTKEYESELETEIKQQTSQIESIEPDETEPLVDYFNDKSTKENTIASKDYLSKSLELTKEDRIKLERARNASAFNTNQQAIIAKPKQTRSRGKPSLRQKSSQGSQYKNKRTRGGKNNLGGLVI